LTAIAYTLAARKTESINHLKNLGRGEDNIKINLKERGSEGANLTHLSIFFSK